METMYDRLGALLSETLDAGEVRFVRVERPEAEAADGSAKNRTYAGPGGASGEQEEPAAGSGGFSAPAGTAARSAAPEGTAERMAEDIVRRVRRERAERVERQQEEYRTAFQEAGRSFFRLYGEERGADGATIYRAGGGAEARPYEPGRTFSYRRVTPEVARAYRLLELDAATATGEDVKRAYKEKLKYYHPDRYDAGNAVLQKVAGDKTQQVVEAYRLLSGFLGG